MPDRTNFLRPTLALMLAVGFVLSVAGPALANATVVVEVMSPDGASVDGVVTLTPRGEGQPKSCTTHSGSCRLTDIPGGRYVVTFRPNEGQPPAPRNVMIPPSGEVQLRVSTR